MEGGTSDNLLCKHESFQQDPCIRITLRLSKSRDQSGVSFVHKMWHILSIPKPFPENGFLILCLNSLFTEPTRNIWSNGIKGLNSATCVKSLNALWSTVYIAIQSTIGIARLNCFWRVLQTQVLGEFFLNCFPTVATGPVAL